MTPTELWVYWVIACGITLNIWMAWKLSGIAGRVLYAAIAAASFTRFAWACGKVHGFKKQKHPSWVYAPLVWWAFFSVELVTGKSGPIEHFGGSGIWSGIGKWKVNPRQEKDE